jgi:hypothetical protein
MTLNRRLFGYGWLVTLILLFNLILFQNWCEARQLERCGNHVNAKIITRFNTTFLLKARYKIEYSFTPSGRNNAIFTYRSVNGRIFRSLIGSKTVPIHYLHNNPSVSNIVGNDTSRSIMIFIVVFNLIVVAIARLCYLADRDEAYWYPNRNRPFK